jgi:hypothetical protein
MSIQQTKQMEPSLGWSIDSDEIKSNNNRIILHRDNSLNGQIKVGANANSMTLTSQDGIYMDGTGDFRVERR